MSNQSELQPEPWTYHLLGLIQLENKNYELAKEYLEKCAKEPDFKWSQIFLLLVHTKKP